MNYIIIAFRSRNDLMAFSKVLRQNRIPHSIVNTPRNVSVSCGMSIKLEYKYYNLILSLLRTSNTQGFMGIYALVGDKAERLF